MLTNRYKQDLLARRAECRELRLLALQGQNLTLSDELDGYIKYYDELLKDSDRIPQEKQLFYRVQEVLDQKLSTAKPLPIDG